MLYELNHFHSSSSQLQGFTEKEPRGVQEEADKYSEGTLWTILSTTPKAYNSHIA